MSNIESQSHGMLEDYFKLMTVNGSAYVFNIAHKMQLLKPFKVKDSYTAAELAVELNFNEKPVELILDTLCSLNIIDKNDSSYSLAPVTKMMTGSYENLSSDYWEHLPTFLTQGTPYKKMDALSDSEKEYQTQVKSLEWMMGPCASLAAKEISTNEGEKILDIGAGSGVWSYAFANKDQSIKATLADWPAVLKVAKQSAKDKKLESRVNYIEGNFHETEFGTEEYDMAILGNVTHIETPQGCADLFKKSHQALKNNGRLLIFDCFGKESAGETARCLYKLGLAIRTQSGEVHMPDTLEKWLKECGFGKFEFKSLDVTPHTMGVLIATKL